MSRLHRRPPRALLLLVVVLTLVQIAAAGAALAKKKAPTTTTTTVAPTSLTTTTTVASTTTTTMPPAMTTTTAPPATTTIPTTTTTAPPPSGNVCNVTATSGDQTVVSNAIAACPNGTAANPTRVSFPGGATYNASGPVRLTDRQHLIIDGNGSTFITTANQNIAGNGNWVVLRGVGVTFEDMTIRGAFNLQPIDCGTAVPPECYTYSLERYPADVGWEPNTGIAFFGTNGGGARDLSIFNVWGDGIMTAFDGIIDFNVPCPGTGYEPCQWQVGRNLTIERVLVDNASRTCMASTEGVNIVYRNNTLRDCWMSGMDHEVDGDANGNIHNNLELRDVRMIGNTFDGHGGPAIGIPVAGDTWQANPADRNYVGNFEIRGNRLLSGPQYYCGFSILVGVPEYDSRNRIHNVVVEDNEIHGMTRFVVFSHVDGGSISNNTFVFKSYGLEGGPQHQCSPTPQVPVAPVVVYDSTNITDSPNAGP